MIENASNSISIHVTLSKSATKSIFTIHYDIFVKTNNKMSIKKSL